MKRLLCVLLILTMVFSITASIGHAEEVPLEVERWFNDPTTGNADGWFCENCGKENSAEANFCPNCASARPVLDWTCTGCGKVNKAEYNFCPKCATPKGEKTPDTDGVETIDIPEEYWGTWELFTVGISSYDEYKESAYTDLAPDQSCSCLLEISSDDIRMEYCEDGTWYEADLRIGDVLVGLYEDGEEARDYIIQIDNGHIPGVNSQKCLRLGQLYSKSAEGYYFLDAYDIEGPDQICFARDSIEEARENFLSRIWNEKYSYYQYDEFADYFRSDEDAFIQLKNRHTFYRDYEGVWRKFDVFSFELADKWQEFTGENLYERWADYGQIVDGFNQYHGIPIGDRLSAKLDKYGCSDEIGIWIAYDSIFEGYSVYGNIYNVGLIRSEVHNWGEGYLELYQLRCYLDPNNTSSYDIFACMYLDEFGQDAESYYSTEPSGIQVPREPETEYSSAIVDGLMNNVDFYAFYPDYEPIEGLASSGHINEDGSWTWWDYLRSSDTKTMYVYNCDEWVSLRTEADAGSTMINKVPFGEPVTVYGGWSEWLLCEYRGEHGWIKRNYLNSDIPTRTTNTGRTETVDHRDIDSGEIGLLHTLWSDHYGYDLFDECGFSRAEATDQIDGVETGSLLNWWLDSSGYGRSASSIPMLYAYEYEGVEVNYGLTEIKMQDSELYTTDYGHLEYYVLCFSDPESQEVRYVLWRLYSEDEGGMDIGSIDMNNIYGDFYGPGETAGDNDKTDGEIPARTGDMTGTLIGTWNVDADALMQGTGTDSAIGLVKALLSFTEAGSFGGVLDAFLALSIRRWNLRKTGDTS